jgi:hypothetical protein
VHRCPPRNRWTPSSRAYPRSARWDGEPLTWKALTRFIEDGDLPADNNWVENKIRPIAIGRSNWLFAGSLRAGQRAAAVMSLLQSARLNGLDPYSYIKDVLTRLPTAAGGTDRGVAAASLGARRLPLIRLQLAGCIACALTRHARFRGVRRAGVGQP